MALVIQTNTAAITAQKNINTNTAAQNQALNRLSSGFRINSASDDSAGFAISSKLDATGARLKSAAQNATQAGALVKTAEAGVNEIQNMIVRLQALAVQASSANNSQELTKLDAERSKLTTEIDNIANSTTFNGVKLLNGTAASGAASSTFSNATSTNIVSAKINSPSASTPNAVYTFGTNAAGDLTTVTEAGSATNLLATNVSFSANGQATVGLTDGASISITFANAAGGAADATDGALTVSGQSSYTADAGATRDIVNVGKVSASVVSSTGSQKTYALTFTGVAVGANTNTIQIKDGANVVGSLAVPTGGTPSQNVTLTNGDVIKITVNAALADGTATKTGIGTLLTSDKSAGGGSTTFQVGAENSSDNQVSVNLGNSYTTAALSITGDLKSASNALAYIDTAKSALDTLITQRADLGATQNQLNFVSANLATSIEQITASVSSIRDADIAVEIANFTKSQILVQAGTAMLAQANQASQNVLRLFR